MKRPDVDWQAVEFYVFAGACVLMVAALVLLVLARLVRAVW